MYNSVQEGVIDAEKRYDLFQRLATNINPPGNPLDTLLDKLGGVDNVRILK